MKFEEVNCVLCGSPAAFSFTDYENRKYYECESNSCGNYEISRRAENDVIENKQQKIALFAQAKLCKGKGKILEVIYSNKGILEATCKDVNNI